MPLFHEKGENRAKRPSFSVKTPRTIAAGSTILPISPLRGRKEGFRARKEGFGGRDRQT